MEKKSSLFWKSLFHLAAGALLLFTSGCATPYPAPSGRAFDFTQDTFAYKNEVAAEFHFDPRTGKRVSVRLEPKPDYTQHCFVVARSARQFFDNARFEGGSAPTDEETYGRLVRQVIRQNPRRPLPPGSQVVIPGYADLKSFSAAHEALLKRECGGAWQSYFQRGHWRMIWPFSRRHQESMAQQLLAAVQSGRPAVVHLVRFPQLSINHAVLLFDGVTAEAGITFSVYDPNESELPRRLVFDQASRTFTFPENPYFKGGRVDAYEIYRSALY